MAHGIKHGTSFLPLKICGNVELKLGAAWTAGKAILPIEEASVKPKMLFT